MIAIPHTNSSYLYYVLSMFTDISWYLWSTEISPVTWCKRTTYQVYKNMIRTKTPSHTRDVLNLSFIFFTIFFQTYFDLCSSIMREKSYTTLRITVFRWFIPVVHAYKYIGKWVCTSNTTIFIEVYYERNINYKTSIRIAI